MPNNLSYRCENLLLLLLLLLLQPGPGLDSVLPALHHLGLLLQVVIDDGFPVEASSLYFPMKKTF